MHHLVGCVLSHTLLSMQSKVWAFQNVVVVTDELAWTTTSSHESDHISTCDTLITWYGSERPTHSILDYIPLASVLGTSEASCYII